MNPNDPAFPTKEPALDPRESGFYTNPGLTRREYFAIRCAAELLNDALTDDILKDDVWPTQIAKAAVKMADKLCAELSRKKCEA